MRLVQLGSLTEGAASASWIPWVAQFLFLELSLPTAYLLLLALRQRDLE